MGLGFSVRGTAVSGHLALYALYLGRRSNQQRQKPPLLELHLTCTNGKFVDLAKDF